MAETRVHRALGPRVAVLSSAGAQATAQTCGAAGVAELLSVAERAARQSTSPPDTVTVHTSQLETRVCDMALRFDPWDAFLSDSAPSTAMDDFLDQVQRTFHDEPDADAEATVQHDAASDRTAPPAWHATFAHAWTEHRPYAPFDTLSHPTALLLAVSSSEPDPMNTLAQLYRDSSSGAWAAQVAAADLDVLRCYVVVHNEAAEADAAHCDALLAEVRETYGLQCAVLRIHAGQASVRAPRSGHHVALSERGVEAVASYVRELVTQSLTPYLERSLHRLHEHVQAQQRGLTGRLLGAGRKWFTAKPAAATAAPLGAQTRRLADLAWHLRDYALAATMAESARREWELEHEALSVASAAELACVARVMSSTGSADAPWQDACAAYAAAPGGRWWALRAAMLYAEAQATQHRDIGAAAGYAHAAQLADELATALLWDQAALACLRAPRPHERRSAAALARAAAQYEACGHTALALRCYTRVAQYYAPRHKPLHDHAQWHMGRLLHQQNRLAEARDHLVALLSGSTAALDRMYMDALAPMAVLAHPAGPATLPHGLWSVADAWLGATHHRAGPWLVAPNELFDVHASVHNRLGIDATLDQIALHFEAVADDGTSTEVASMTVPRISLAPHERRPVVVAAAVPTPGRARLARVTYTLNGILPVVQRLEKRGARCAATHAQRTSTTYAPDTSLVVHVRAGIPRLQVHVDAPAQAWLGAAVSVTLALRNVGECAARHIRVSSAHAMAATAEGSSWPWATPRAAPVAVPDMEAHADQRVCVQMAPRRTGHVELAWTIEYEAQHTVAIDTLWHAQVRMKLAEQAQPSHLVLLELTQQAVPTAHVEGIALLSPQWTAAGVRWAPHDVPRGVRVGWLWKLARPTEPDVLEHTARAVAPFLTGAAPPSDAPGQLDAHVSVSGTQPQILQNPETYTQLRAPYRLAQLAAALPALPSSCRRTAFPWMDAHELDIVARVRVGDAPPIDMWIGCVKVGVGGSSAASAEALLRLVRADAASHDMYAETTDAKVRARAQLADRLGAAQAPVTVWAAAQHLDDAVTPHAAPVTLHVRNEAPWPLAFTLRLSRTEPQGDVAAWVGRTVHRGAVAPWATTSVRAHALLSAPGVWRLGAWTCEATFAGSDGSVLRTWHAHGGLCAALTARPPA